MYVYIQVLDSFLVHIVIYIYVIIINAVLTRALGFRSFFKFAQGTNIIITETESAIVVQ